jgi:ATP-dependent RNA helicase DeaD
MVTKEKEQGFFGSLALSHKVMAAIQAMGFEEPSPIQAKTIPPIMEGLDVIGQAQTGTGKTAAFGIPIIEKVQDIRQVQALIMTPTRELALQVSEEIAKIGQFKKIKTLPVYGGQSIDRQIRALHFGVQVVIGTPGRLLDHIRRKTINLEMVKMLILDEADEMLDMGFIDDIMTIMENIPKEGRQTMLFSATMPQQIRTLADRYMNKPVFVTVSKEQLTVPQIDQYYYETREKLEGLCSILDAGDMERTIVFSRTKKGADELTSSLNARGYMAEALHGDLSQIQRDRVMKKFRDGKLEILVATDVAARGLDVENVTHVVNYDIPQDPESYVHRIGRTGRAGKKGTAVTFIHPREFRQLKQIERELRLRIIRGQLPSPADILERQREVIKRRIVKTLEQDAFADYHPIVAELSADYDPIDIAAAALKLFQEGFKEGSEAETQQPQSGNSGAEAGMVRLFVNAGRDNNIRPEDIVRTFAGEADIPGSSIGLIKIYSNFSFVEVPEDLAERVVSAMHGNRVKGLKINVEVAKGK